MQLSGCYTALVTPFRNGQVDFDALGVIVEQQMIDRSCHYDESGAPKALIEQIAHKALHVKNAHILCSFMKRLLLCIPCVFFRQQQKLIIQCKFKNVNSRVFNAFYI